MNREYLIYDVWSLIGTVGGALGLFVGFSFYDFVSLVIDFICKRLEKVRPETHSPEDLEKGNESLPDFSVETQQYRNGDDIIEKCYRKNLVSSDSRLEEILSLPFTAQKQIPRFSPYLHSASRFNSKSLDLN